MSNVVSLVSNDVSWLVNELNKSYHEGKIETLVFAVSYTDGTFNTGHTGKSHIEKLGLTQSLADTIHRHANE